MSYLHDADFVASKLPQKYPLLLIDRVISHDPGRGIVCMKNLTQNEEFFNGHFVGRKIMPGVLICEALAQSCALFGILEAERLRPSHTGEAQLGFIASINIKFIEPAFPGDQLLLRVAPLKSMGDLNAFDVEALVEKRTICKGVIKTARRGDGA